MRQSTILATLGLCLTLIGCASTSVDTSGAALKEPLCQAGAEKLSVLVFWGPIWRPDQKEPARREAAALRGIQDFFANSGCMANADIRRLMGERSAEVPADAQLLALASAAKPPADRVLVIVVRELGPTLRIGIPVLVQGTTEVVVEVRVLNARTGDATANLRTHWQNGGTFVIKGVKTLEHDMSAALRAALISTDIPQ
jgi:hypothetical protein